MMAGLWLDAAHIIEGAVNPLAVARAILNNMSELFEETRSMTAIKENPAIRLMVGHLAAMYGVGEPKFEDIELLKSVMDWE